MKNRKTNFIKLGILLLGISFLLKNCEIKEDLENLNQEQLMDLNLKTVSFEEAQNFFKKNQKENIKLFAAKGTEPLELTPNWNSIKHEDLYKIEQAQLTEVNVKINRDGDYISKLLFIKINNIIESIIFTIYQKEVDSKGKILEANFYLNKLNGAFIDGYKIEEGKITKQFILKDKNIQEASFFSFFQENEAGCWESAGCNLEPITVRARLDSGFSIIADVVGIYSVGPSEDGEVSTIQGGGDSGSSATSVAGSIYVTQTTKTDEEGNDVNEKEKCIAIGKVYNETTKKCECPQGKVEDANGNCIDKPCEGDPVPNPEIVSSGKSGKKGGTFGCTRSNWKKICEGVKGKKKHDGIDIKADVDTPTFAMYNGTISSIRNTFNPGQYLANSYGNYIVIKAKINGVTTFIKYNHLNKVNVKVGDTVKAGDIIGLNGNTGNANPPKGSVVPHIHLQVYNSSWKSIDPMNYLKTKFDNQYNQIISNCN